MRWRAVALLKGNVGAVSVKGSGSSIMLSGRILVFRRTCWQSVPSPESSPERYCEDARFRLTRASSLPKDNGSAFVILQKEFWLVMAVNTAYTINMVNMNSKRLKDKCSNLMSLLFK